MDVMLRKLRTIWRWTADIAASSPPPATGDTPAVREATPSQTESAASAISSPEANSHASPPAASIAKRPSTRVQRITTDVAALRGDMRTLESKIDAVQSRSDRLLQSIQSAGPRESVDLADVRGELQSLRVQLEEQREHHASFSESMRMAESRFRDSEAASTTLASKLEQQGLRLSEAQERHNNLAAHVESLQVTLQNTIESINAMRTELAAHDALRTREVAGRMVGLYVVGCVALTVAIATLVILITGIGIRQ